MPYIGSVTVWLAPVVTTSRVIGQAVDERIPVEDEVKYELFLLVAAEAVLPYVPENWFCVPRIN